MFETATYAAPSLEYSIESEAVCPATQKDNLTDSLAAFLWRVAAYFQGCLSSLPHGNRAAQEPLTVMDTALDTSAEPLQVVRMNRALSRRLRWLIKRGRVERSGKLRVITADDEARRTLTPGQFNEYSIRVHRMNRVRVYGLGLGRRALLLCAVSSEGLQGDGISLRKTALCLAPLSPD